MRQPDPTKEFIAKAIPALSHAVNSAVTAALGRKVGVNDPLRKLESYPVRMTVRQLSTYWGCCAQHVHNLIDSGEIIAINIATSGASQRCLRITRASVEAYEAKQL